MRSRVGFVTYHSHATHFTNSDLQLEMNDRQHGSRPRNTRPSNSCRTSIIVAIDGLPSECVSERTSHARKCRLEDDHNSARFPFTLELFLALSSSDARPTRLTQFPKSHLFLLDDNAPSAERYRSRMYLFGVHFVFHCGF